jgi:DNA topoisomerase III
MIVVIAEKPSVARELAQVLGANAKRDGYFEGDGYRVTWAVGHLVAIAAPDEIEPAWKVWARDTLPMLPERFPLKVLETGRAQYRVVERLLRARETTEVIAATDAGREGELIFRLIYEHAGCAKPWQRMWLASMTDDAIRAAFSKLEPGNRYDGLAAAARARSEADWLVGMNLSRAYTLTGGTLYTVGRVQTPTLAMVVGRDAEIRSFVPQPYLEIEATFEGRSGTYKGTYYRPPAESMRDELGRLRAFQPLQARFPADGRLAAEVSQRASTGRARVALIEQSQRRTAAPQLFDLTALQKECNRLYGFTAQATLDAAQALYEKHRALSYPRTDSRHLSTAVAATLPQIVAVVAPHYAGLVAAKSGIVLPKRWVDDTKVGDHHALIPTTQLLSLPSNSNEARVYDLVCRRLLMPWHEELVEAVTRLVTEVKEPVGRNVDLFVTQGVAVERPGWTVLEPPTERSARGLSGTPPRIPAGLAEGGSQRVADVSVHRKQTQPPRPHSEATLLASMESAGRRIEDKALREAMRESGLGTPATRAAIIEMLLARGYIARSGKMILSTPLGQALIAAVHPLVASAEMTGRWEKRLRAMERGYESTGQFMGDIRAYVSEVVAGEANKPVAPRALARPVLAGLVKQRGTGKRGRRRGERASRGLK